jgi:hypothetical protein
VQARSESEIVPKMLTALTEYTLHSYRRNERREDRSAAVTAVGDASPALQARSEGRGGEMEGRAPATATRVAAVGGRLAAQCEVRTAAATY